MRNGGILIKSGMDIGTAQSIRMELVLEVKGVMVNVDEKAVEMRTSNGKCR